MNTAYLISFFLGLALSVLAAFSGLGRVHLGHFGHGAHAGHGSHGAGKAGGTSFLNGWTLPAFLCWFGAAGYVLDNYTPFLTLVVLLLACGVGLLGAAIIYLVLVRFLLARERVLRPEDTRMEGTVGRISSPVLAGGGLGEVLYLQLGARRFSPARAADGQAIPRGTEVVVLEYARGVALVRPLHEYEGFRELDGQHAPDGRHELPSLRELDGYPQNGHQPQNLRERHAVSRHPNP